MKSEPRVTLVLVAHDAAAHVDRCLESLRAQDYPIHLREFILVHGGCEKTAAKMREWKSTKGQNEDVSILVRRTRENLAAGWNVALAAARGDVIVRLDAHSRAEPFFLRRCVDAIVERGEWIVGGRRPSEAPTRWWPFLCWMAERSLMGAGQAAYRRRTRPGYVDTLAHAAYHRHVFEVVGGYDERLSRTEDNEIHHRMKRAGFRFYFDPSIVSHHLARPTVSGLLRQKFLNGYGVAMTLPISPRCFSLRHFAAAGFVVALCALAAMALGGWSEPLLVLVATYGFCAALAAAAEAVRAPMLRGAILTPLLPLMFLGMHVANGMGLLGGLLVLPLRMASFRDFSLPHPCGRSLCNPEQVPKDQG